MSDLDGEIGRYVALGQYRYREVKLPRAVEPSERSMTAAEAHDARLSLPWLNRGEALDPKVQEAEVAEALRHDPGNVAALAILAARKPAEAAALAEKATAAHPRDARAWLLLAGVLPAAPAERRVEVLGKAVEADPDNALALNHLALGLLLAGEAEQATAIARKAVELAPGEAAYRATLAGIAEARGHCAPALELQRRAVDLLPERAPAERRASYLVRLGRLEATCGGGGEVPADPPDAPSAPPAGE